MRYFENDYHVSHITAVREEDLCHFFNHMRTGIIKTKRGNYFKATADYVKVFKAFWHWHQKVSRKAGKEIMDITTELDYSSEKPKWVYLTEKEIYNFCDNAKYKYQVLIMFLFDTGIRAPTELMNLKVSDLDEDCKELHIRDEISKTFGRKIKLMLCSELLKGFIKYNNLKKDDYIFMISPSVVNRYLKMLSGRLFGDKQTMAGGKYSELTMYDFRHISCCYWLPRYKSESALKYRFGWKGSDKIHYYSEMLGMKDTITEDDIYIGKEKTVIEKELETSKKENELLKERLNSMELQMSDMSFMIKEMITKIKEKESGLLLQHQL